MAQITGQQAFEAYKKATAEMPPLSEEVREFIQAFPDQWEDLSEGDKATFEEIAWKMNFLNGVK